jgi:hypothetical protein
MRHYSIEGLAKKSYKGVRTRQLFPGKESENEVSKEAKHTL